MVTGENFSLAHQFHFFANTPVEFILAKNPSLFGKIELLTKTNYLLAKMHLRNFQTREHQAFTFILPRTTHMFLILPFLQDNNP